MAKNNKKKHLSDKQIVSHISKAVQDAVGFCADHIELKQEEALRLYKREPLPGDDRIKFRSKWVSPDVLERVDWSTASVVRIFDTSANVVEFQPNGPEDEPLARQQTDVVNFIVRNKNSHVAMLEPWLKNGFITGLGITMVEFASCNEEGLPELLKGVPESQLVELTAQEEAGTIIIEEASEPYAAPMSETPSELPPEIAQMAQALMPQPNLYDLKIRRVRKQRHMNIVNLPPENFIVSKDAAFDQQTGGIKAKLQGHRRLISRSDLIEQGFDREKVESIPSASDVTDGIAMVRSDRLDGDQGVSDVEDEVTVYEIYTKMAIDDSKRRHYRITLAGDLESAPILLNYEEVSKFYPYAAFCPFPLPNTLFGHGIADRIGADQILLSKMQRGIIDNLNMHVHPTKVINPDVTNPDDALNVHPGAVIRSTDPSGGITYNQPPFTGANALPVMEQIKQTLDFTTGVGGGMMAVNASDLQNTTATATSQRANSSQLFVELICRFFADTGYRYLFKIIVDLLVSHPEDAIALITRLTGRYEAIRVDEWDPDLDVTATVAFGVMNKDFNAAMLQTILVQQQQMLANGLPFVAPQNIYTTLIKMAENAGFKNPNAFWIDPSTLPPPPPPQPAPDPNAGLIEVEKIKAQLKAQADEQKAQLDLLKLRVEDDRKRDEMLQKMMLQMSEISARYGAQIDLARIQQQQAAQRNDVDFAIAAQQTQAEQAAAQAQAFAQAQAQQQQALQQQQAVQPVQSNQGPIING